VSLLALIPSPSQNAIHIGPLQLRAYGLCIAMGVIAAVLITQRRWERDGGNPDDIASIALWAVPAGLIGARLYHVLTDWRRFEGHWLDVFAVWKGGLGIPGGLVVGVGVGVWLAKRKGMDIRRALDAVAPALPVAQAIGRLGNWFNQELYGRATSLPWALRIDPAHRPPGYENVVGYHPTFLYEALWNLALAGLLVYIGKRWKPPPGTLFAGYVAGYSLGRLWVEALRIDPASLILGIRVNIWVSGISFIVGVIAILWLCRGWRPGRTATGASEGDGPADTDADGVASAEPVATGEAAGSRVGPSPPEADTDRDTAP
jgi:prolipoprotein diacylglyceryl transferase